jgi:hypothetical protein
LFGTTGNAVYNCFKSKDAVSWEPESGAFVWPTGGWQYDCTWAPEVIYHNGKFVMHYTARSGELKSLRLGVAVSDSPTGPFIDVHNKPMFDFGYAAIDGSILISKEGNYLYLRMNTANDVKDNISTLRLDGIDKLLPEEDIENNTENSIYTGLEIINSITKLSDTNNRKYLQLAERDIEGNWRKVNNEVIDTDLFAMDDGIIPIETLRLTLSQ